VPNDGHARHVYACMKAKPQVSEIEKW